MFVSEQDSLTSKLNGSMIEDGLLDRYRGKC